MLIGPAMLVALPNVRSAVLVDLPSVNPDTSLPRVQLLSCPVSALVKLVPFD